MEISQNINDKKESQHENSNEKNDINSNISQSEEYSNLSPNPNENEYDKYGLRETGDYIGDRKIKKDPDEMKHLFEICAAYFNYKVNLK